MIIYIDNRLKRWADWLAQGYVGSGGANGLISAIYGMAGNVIGDGCSVASFSNTCTVTDEEALDTDRAIAKLSSDDRRLIKLIYRDGYGQVSAAAAEGCSDRTIRNRLGRIHIQIMEWLQCN